MILNKWQKNYSNHQWMNSHNYDLFPYCDHIFYVLYTRGNYFRFYEEKCPCKLFLPITRTMHWHMECNHTFTSIYWHHFTISQKTSLNYTANYFFCTYPLHIILHFRAFYPRSSNLLYQKRKWSLNCRPHTHSRLYSD